MSRRIVQFGTIRFLQAHFDLFVHEALASGRDIGRSPSSKPLRMLAAPPGCRRFVGPQDFLFKFAAAETA